MNLQQSESIQDIKFLETKYSVFLIRIAPFFSFIIYDLSESKACDTFVSVVWGKQ